MFKYLIGATMRSRDVMINCKRKMAKRRLPYHKHVKANEYRRLLVDNLGMEKTDVGNVLRYQDNIFNISADHIVEQGRLFKNFNINPKTLFMNATLMGWSSHMLENRVLLLQEMGVQNIHAAILSNFYHLMNMHMGMFKAYTGIPKDENVAKNLLNCLDPAPDGVPPLEELSDMMSVTEYHERCLRWYFEWKLQISREDEQLMNRVIFYMRNKSFTRMRTFFDILHHEIGLTLEEIKKYECLSSSGSDDLRKIIDNVKTFAGIDIKKIIKEKPVLHKMNYKNVVELKKLLAEHGFTNMRTYHFIKILLTPKNTVDLRFEQFQNRPELRVLKNNSNSLQLIYAFNRVQLRLNYLNYLNIKHATVRTLTASSKNFERFVRTRIDKTTGREIGKSLEKILRLEANELRRRIEKHPYWRHIDLVSIHETLNFLLERFSPEDLHDSLQLILYPREKIEENLNSLPELNQQSVDNKIEYSSKHIVALVLYEIEREYHFSGDGVWRCETLQPRQLKSSKISYSESVSDFSDSEGTETEDPDELTSEQPFTIVNKDVITKI